MFKYHFRSRLEKQFTHNEKCNTHTSFKAKNEKKQHRKQTAKKNQKKLKEVKWKVTKRLIALRCGWLGWLVSSQSQERNPFLLDALWRLIVDSLLPPVKLLLLLLSGFSFFFLAFFVVVQAGFRIWSQHDRVLLVPEMVCAEREFPGNGTQMDDCLLASKVAGDNLD